MGSPARPESPPVGMATAVPLCGGRGSGLSTAGWGWRLHGDGARDLENEVRRKPVRRPKLLERTVTESDSAWPQEGAKTRKKTEAEKWGATYDAHWKGERDDAEQRRTGRYRSLRVGGEPVLEAPPRSDRSLDAFRE